MRQRAIFLGVFFLAASGRCADMVATATRVVIVPVADVRTQPAPHNDKYEFDPNQETQVVEGERVSVFEKRGDWTRVACPEQPEFTHNKKWEGYPGWVKTAALSADLKKYSGLRRSGLSEPEFRAELVRQAERHIGSPYLWGGRSLHNAKITTPLTGVDCSGLINWSFRQLGWIVPRDAHEQYMKATPIEPSAMRKGDLIFTGRMDQVGKITHVAMYAGNGELIEAPQSGEKVRRITILKKYGKKLEELKAGEPIGTGPIYFGSLITPYQ